MIKDLLTYEENEKFEELAQRIALLKNSLSKAMYESNITSEELGVILKKIKMLKIIIIVLNFNYIFLGYTLINIDLMFLIYLPFCFSILFMTSYCYASYNFKILLKRIF
jgi:hypothetical protein